MSKYLIKILSVCAVVILLPLVIVGSALCVTEAMGCTLTVVADGTESTFAGAGTESTISIFIDGEKQESNKIVVKKNTEVTVTYTGTGYDFQGWYKGNYAELNANSKAESTETAYTFAVRQSQVMTAVRNVKKYTVTYAGTMDDGETAVNITPATEQVVYGQPLQVVESLTDAIWEGWYVADSQLATPTKVANFPESGSYTLNPVFGNQMAVTYYKGTTPIKTNYVMETTYGTYALLGEADVAEYITPGYTFAGWEYDGNVIAALPEYKPEGYALYLKESLNEYVVVVKKSAVDDTTTNISYNVRAGFANYTVTRGGYNLLGLKYNDVIYSYNDTTKDYTNDSATLSTFVMANNGLTVTAVWKSVYEDDYFFSMDLIGRYENDGSWWAVKSDYGTDDNSSVERMGVSVNFIDDPEYFDLQDDVIAYLTEGRTNLRTLAADGSAAVELANNATITILCGGRASITTFVNADGTFTFADLMNALEGAEWLDANFANSHITVRVEYTVA